MKVILLGAANPETGRMIAAIRKVDPEFTVLGFLDNDSRKKGIAFLGLPIFGGFEVLENFIREDVHFVNLITGSTKVRYETSYHMAQAGCKFTNFIHPTVDLTAVAMESATIFRREFFSKPRLPSEIIPASIWDP